MTSFRATRRKPFPATPGRKYPAFFGTPLQDVQFQNGGEYDFSDEKLQDTVGIKPPKPADQRETFLGAAKRTELPGRNGLRPERP